jgi:four helix bundle protein
MEVYRYALFAADLAWFDVSKLAQDQRTLSLSDQLYRAVDSVGANIAKGYSRRSGKDQARFDEYALGSARRQLLTIIPHERGYKMSEQRAEYLTDGAVLLRDVPLP